MVAARAVNLIDKGLVIVIAAIYIVMAGFFAFTLDPRIIKFALVPAATFAVVTLVRAYINAPRPYELFDIDPIIAKDTHGLSMPSRHVASAVIIACAITWITVPGGIAALLASVLVAAARIVGGVHFPRDVFAAMAISAAFGAIGFAVVP